MPRPRIGDLRIVKIGGSLLSDKTRPYSIRLERLMEIGAELAEALDETGLRLLVVHGGGSYGHYVASLHLKEKGGYDSESFSLIADTMAELALTVSDALRASGIKAAVFSTHAMWTGQGLALDSVAQALSIGVVPVLYGDIVVGGGEVEILSGDTIVRDAALALGARQVYFASDVDGVYDRNPRDLGARLVREMCWHEAQRLSSELVGGGALDVTGGMALKLRVMAELASRGISSTVFNGLRRGSFYKALTGTLEQYSVVKPCSG